MKVADFGLSNTVSTSATGAGYRARTPVGTPLYSAPEVLFPYLFQDILDDGQPKQIAAATTAAAAAGNTANAAGGAGITISAPPDGRVYTGALADLWSMGVILYRMVYGRLPFPAENMRQLRSAIFDKGLRFPPSSASSQS